MASTSENPRVMVYWPQGQAVSVSVYRGKVLVTVIRDGAWVSMRRSPDEAEEMAQALLAQAAVARAEALEVAA